MRLVAALLAVVLGSTSAFADEAATIDKWFIALFQANGPALEQLLTADAEIELRDLGVTQTRAQFIDSMGEWAVAIRDGKIRFKQDGAASTYKVCYEFAESEVMTREVFTFANGLIARSVQTRLADNCAGY